MTVKTHDFGEKQTEYYPKTGEQVPVIQSAKYRMARKKAEEIIDSGKYGVEDGDFWILTNATKTKKMMYSGLILSHNGCLKINDAQAENLRFRPSCVKEDKDGYRGSLVYTYCCDEQGVYEVGEASDKNCKNDYPYAMAYKRLFDRVVLKLSKLAFAGIYSDSESDEFAETDEHKLAAAGAQADTPPAVTSKPQRKNTAPAPSVDEEPFDTTTLKATEEQKQYIIQAYGDRLPVFLEYAKITDINELSYAVANLTVNKLKKRSGAQTNA